MSTPPKSPDMSQTADEIEQTATGRVLKFVSGQTQEALASEWDHDQEKIDLDERWLMTYADKMSLVCGVFVMLFAISTVDKAKFQAVKNSAAQVFGGSVSTAPAQPAPDYETQIIDMRTTIEQLQKQIAYRDNEIRELKRQEPVGSSQFAPTRRGPLK